VRTYCRRGASTTFGATLSLPPLSSKATFGAGRFLPQPLKKSFEFGSVLKTPKNMIIFLDLKLLQLCTNVGIT